VARTWTDDQLIAALTHSRTIADVCRRLGVVPRGGSYEVVRRHIKRLGLDTSGFKRRVTDEEFADAVKGARTLAEVAELVGARSLSNVRARIERLGLDASHFRGQGWRRGSKVPVRAARPLSEILVVGTSRADTSKLKRRLIGEGMKEHCCEVGGLVEWNDLPIPLELDHINGRRDDNRLENLRLICPNCHAQTPTYRGRNIGRYFDPPLEPGGQARPTVSLPIGPEPKVGGVQEDGPLARAMAT
jgi:transposase-like protein